MVEVEVDAVGEELARMERSSMDRHERSVTPEVSPFLVIFFNVNYGVF